MVANLATPLSFSFIWGMVFDFAKNMRISRVKAIMNSIIDISWVYLLLDWLEAEGPPTHQHPAITSTCCSFHNHLLLAQLIFMYLNITLKKTKKHDHINDFGKILLEQNLGIVFNKWVFDYRSLVWLCVCHEKTDVVILDAAGLVV